MPGKLLYSVITPHSPRMAVEETAPAFLKGVIEGSHALGATLRDAKPDLLIVHSTHWVCSFNWYVTCHERHRGHCVADEAPDVASYAQAHATFPHETTSNQWFNEAQTESYRALGLHTIDSVCASGRADTAATVGVVGWTVHDLAPEADAVSSSVPRRVTAAPGPSARA